jgi:hypothetical protein
MCLFNDMCLSCHVYNMMAVYALLGTMRHARETVCKCNLLDHLFIMLITNISIYWEQSAFWSFCASG